MGLVFTPEQIRSRDYPEVGAHHEALREFIGRVAGLMTDDQDFSVTGMTGYGSVPAGFSNRRSDIDVLGCFRVGERTYDDLKRVAIEREDIEKSHKVKFEPRFFELGATVALEHHQDPAYIAYLASRQYKKGPFACGADPLEAIRGLDIPSTAEDVVAYLEYKSYETSRFATHFRPDDDERAKYLQRMLELPKAIARKYFFWQKQIGGYGGAIASEDKKGLRNGFDDVFGDQPRIWAPFQRLSSMDEEYTDLLEQVIKRPSIGNLANYERIFYELDSAGALHAVQLVASMTSFMLKNHGIKVA